MALPSSAQAALSKEGSLSSLLSDANWNVLKLSVRNSPLYLPCSQGTVPFAKGDFVATLSASHNSDRIIDVNTRAQSQERGTMRPSAGFLSPVGSAALGFLVDFLI